MIECLPPFGRFGQWSLLLLFVHSYSLLGLVIAFIPSSIIETSDSTTTEVPCVYGAPKFSKSYWAFSNAFILDVLEEPSAIRSARSS